MEDSHEGRQHCRFYENEYPKIDEVVMVEVRPAPRSLSTAAPSGSGLQGRWRRLDAVPAH